MNEAWVKNRNSYALLVEMYLFGKHQSIKIIGANYLYLQQKADDNTYCLSYTSMHWSAMTSWDAKGLEHGPLRPPLGGRGGECWEKGSYLTAPAARGTSGIPGSMQTKAGPWLNTAGFYGRAIPAQWTPPTTFALAEMFSKLHCSLTLLDPCQSSFSFPS